MGNTYPPDDALASHDSFCNWVNTQMDFNRKYHIPESLGVTWVLIDSAYTIIIKTPKTEHRIPGATTKDEFRSRVILGSMAYNWDWPDTKTEEAK